MPQTKKKTHNLIVIKIGSSSLTDKSGKLDTDNLRRLVSEIAGLIQEWKKIIIVTSGAIVTGSEKLGITEKVKTIPDKQAAAAVGQSLLMKEYEKAFSQYNITVAQVLLTRDAIADRERYINARNTLSTLLEMGCVPIVNENDTVSVDEIKIGDNDNLSALVASLMGADLLINLTDIDGFYIKGPDQISQLVPEVREITKDIEDAAGHPGTQIGVGGMITKIQAAKITGDTGIPMVIAHGRHPNVIREIIEGKKIGTYFHPKVSKLESRKRWLAHGLPIKGTLVVDGGAESALTKSGRSLLSVGILDVKGKFETGDSVSIVDESHKEIARGLVNYSKEELDKIKGLKSDKIDEVLGYPGIPEVVHRDNLVVL